MLSAQFYEHFNSFPNLKKRLAGICSADTIPKSLQKDQFLICNTDHSSGLGKHWYCLYKPDLHSLECFDSLGIDEIKKDFLTKTCHLKGIDQIHFNVTQVQSSTSTSCGLFVLYFLVNRFYNKDLSFDELLNEIFVKSQSVNEEKVENFFRLHFCNDV